MPRHNDEPDMHGGRMRLARSRGALTGLLLILAGAWGALVPLIGPVFDFGYSPDKTFDFTAGRVWYEVLPGAAAAVAGLLIAVAANRAVVNFAGWLAIAAGAWFLVGPTLNPITHLGSVGSPLPKSSTIGGVLETLLLFTGIGALIVALGGIAVGRLSVVSVRDVRSAQRRENSNAPSDNTDHRDREAELTAAEQRGYDRRTDETNRTRTGGVDGRPAPTAQGTGASVPNTLHQ